MTQPADQELESIPLSSPAIGDDEAAAVEHARNRRIDFRTDACDLSLEIEARNARRVAHRAQHNPGAARSW